MVSKALTVRFDYTTVGKEEKGKLIYLAGEIKKANSSHLKFGIAVGEAVAKAHALLACDGKDGQFSAWVEAECGFGRTTAYKYMQVWDAFNDCEVIDQFDLSALQTLSAPKAPEKARIEAVKLAKKGEHITNDRSKELCDQFREKPAPNPKNNGVVVHNVNNSNDHDASVTGTPSTSKASPPVLPSVGTVNRTDEGSQGSGGAGECPKEDYGKCPNCAGTKWTEDIECGVVCSRCSHPHGEPAGEVDDQRKTDARSKTIKTAEALMRAFDDLNLLASHPKEHANAILQCKFLIKEARDWR